MVIPIGLFIAATILGGAPRLALVPRAPRAGEPVAVVLLKRTPPPPGCFAGRRGEAICMVGIPVDAMGHHAVEVGGEKVVVKLSPRRDRRGHVVFRVWTPKSGTVADAGARAAAADAGAGAVPGAAESDVPIAGRDAIRAATSSSAPERLWRGPFIWPARGGGHPFGVVRNYTRYRDGVLERKWQGRHLGVDIGARRGAPVRAANDGRVVLTGHFFGTGRCIYLDHGLGLFTMYFHLARVDAKMGDRVARGQVIGRVGSTGSSTAPHLHWEARIGRTSIDPSRLPALSRKLGVRTTYITLSRRNY